MTEMAFARHTFRAQLLVTAALTACSCAALNHSLRVFVLTSSLSFVYAFFVIFEFWPHYKAATQWHEAEPVRAALTEAVRTAEFKGLRLREACEELQLLTNSLEAQTAAGEDSVILRELYGRAMQTRDYVRVCYADYQMARLHEDDALRSAQASLVLSYTITHQALSAKLRDWWSGHERAGESITSLAAFVAGRGRADLHGEWLADLAGAPECGLTPSPWQRVRMAAGFVVAALRMRAHDLSAPLWRPVEWLVSKEERTNTFIALVIGIMAVYIDVSGGLRDLIVEGIGSCGVAGTSLYALANWVRRARSVELVGRRRPDDKA